MKFINGEVVELHLTMNKAIELMQKALIEYSSKSVLQPLRTMMKLDDSERKVLALMPAGYEKGGVFGVKVISAFFDNKMYGLRSHQGVVMLFDSATGTPLSVVDGEAITAIRTSAVSAVAIDLLAPQEIKKLAILGSGLQAEKHLEAIKSVRSIQRIAVWSRATINAKAFSTKFPEDNIVVCKSVKEAVTDADVICCVTAAKEPILAASDINTNAIICAAGSCSTTTRELSTDLIAQSILITDSRESLFNEAGDFTIPLSEGAINKDHCQAEIGELLIEKGQRPEYLKPVVFKTLGLAIEDILCAQYVYKCETGLITTKH